MLKDIVEVRPLGGYRLHLRFEDGAEGTVDVSQHVRFDGVFEPLREREYFERVRVDEESGTICWPNGADLDPDVLYSRVVGKPIELESEAKL
jgi:hypothetical protein